MVYTHPDVFEFNGPIRASYPPWYDPSYWNDGMSPKFNIGIVFRHFVHTATNILLDFTRPRIWLLGTIFLLCLSDPGATVRGVFRYWYLIVPSVCVFAAYSLTFAEFRYMPAWLLAVWASVLAGLRLRPGVSLHVAKSVAISVSVVMMASMAYGFYGQSKSVRHDDATNQYSIAEGLAELGVRRGDKVGAIGFDNDAHWAYLDGLMVVAEVRTDAVCSFWALPTSNQSDVLRKFAEAGARAIVVNADHHFKSTSRDEVFDFAACSNAGGGWHKIAGTEDFVYFPNNERSY
jgi:hypothetical protein